MTKLIRVSSYPEVLNALVENLRGKTNGINQKNLIFSEEKISLMTERRICAEFTGSFNTDVYSFGNYLRKKKRIEKLLTKEGSVMVIKKIISEIPLKRYKGSSLSLAPSFYELLIQLKSAKISPEDLEIAKEKCNGLLKDKLSDMVSVYRKYEEYVESNGFEDQSSVLSYLPEIIENDAQIKNTDVYLIGYESFTAQARAIITSLIKNAKSVTAILITGKNRFAFVGETAEYFESICLSLGEKIEIIDRPSGYGTTAKRIVDGLFNPKEFYGDKLQTQEISYCVCKTVREEVERVAEIIKHGVMQGEFRYKDVSVAVASSEKYGERLKSAFNMLDIPYFFDEKKRVENHPLIRLIVTYAQAFISGFERGALSDFYKNPFISPDKNFADRFENYLIKCNVNYGRIKNQFTVVPKNKEDFEEFEKFRSRICEYFTEFDVKKLLESLDVENKIAEFSEKLSFYNENEEGSVNEQVYKSVQSILGEMQLILGTLKTDVKEFKKLFLSGISALELSIIPQYNDAVFVGDFKEVAFANAKYVFAIGLDWSVPVIKDDVALLSDNDITALSDLKLLVEPQIRIINKRERERTVLGLSAFKDGLYLSYAMTDDSGKSNVKSEIISFFSNRFNLKPFPERKKYVTEKQGLSLFAKECSEFVNGLTSNVTELTSFYKLDKTGKANRILENANSELKTRLNANKEIMVKGVTSPTAIEAYASCPYKFFVSNALKVRERERGVASADVIGTLMHEIFNEYVKNIHKVNDKTSSDKLVDELTTAVLNSGKFPDFSNDASEKYKVKEGIRQCREFCYKNYLWLKNSQFTPKKDDLEVKFGENCKYGAVSLLNGKIKLSGKIDRVDSTDDYFRVIDYKSGKADISEKGLYAGVKLQLYLYALAVSQSSNKSLAGAYYMPLSDDYTQEERDGALTLGRSLLDEQVLKMLDETFDAENKSGFIGSDKKELLEKDTIDKYLEYAKRISEKLAEHMEQGFIPPSPYDKACTYCEFKPMCQGKFSPRTVGTINREHITSALSYTEEKEVKDE